MSNLWLKKLLVKIPLLGDIVIWLVSLNIMMDKNHCNFDAFNQMFMLLLKCLLWLLFHLKKLKKNDLYY